MKKVTTVDSFLEDQADVDKFLDLLEGEDPSPDTGGDPRPHYIFGDKVLHLLSQCLRQLVGIHESLCQMSAGCPRD